MVGTSASASLFPAPFPAPGGYGNPDTPHCQALPDLAVTRCDGVAAEHAEVDKAEPVAAVAKVALPSGWVFAASPRVCRSLCLSLSLMWTGETTAARRGKLS